MYGCWLSLSIILSGGVPICKDSNTFEKFKLITENKKCWSKWFQKVLNEMQQYKILQRNVQNM